MAKLLAYFTGLVLSLMVTFNGLLSGFTSAYMSNVVYHAFGLVFFGIFLLLLRQQRTDGSKFKWYYLIPGVLGSLTIILNNVVLNVIGVTMMVAFTLVGQVITSIVIDHWGLLGKSITRSTRKQWLGVGIMIVGLATMVL
jgi:transporter family-2 protein